MNYSHRLTLIKAYTQQLATPPVKRAASTRRFFQGSVLGAMLVVMGLAHPIQSQAQTYDCASQTVITVADCEALVALYNATDGPNWTNNTNWLTGTPSTWSGVSVGSGRVTELDLDGDGLNGSLPGEIGDLTALTILVLSHNQLAGSIPSAIGNLTSLQILLFSSNQLSGTIPSAIGNLTNLKELHLDTNQLSGSIPSAIGNLTTLEVLSASQNQLSGIPSTIDQLANLEFLNLGENQISGSIPPELGDLAALDYLNLKMNQLTGSIPPEIGNLSNLRTLNLSENQLSGSIPIELGDISSPALRIFIILNGNQLNGLVPSDLADAPLRILNLSNNQLTGAFPAEVADLEQLDQLIINGNQFEDFPALQNSLSILRIADNRFTFEDIEPNIGVASTFMYSPQALMGEPVTSTVFEGGNLTLHFLDHGASNQYQWYKDSSPIAGTTDTYTIPSASPARAGDYVLKITNTVATELTLESHPITVVLTPPVFGTTIIAHGFSLGDNTPNTQLEWMIDMASAIHTRAGKGQVLIYDKASGNFLPNFLPNDPLIDPPIANDPTGETILLFEWARESNEDYLGFSEAAGSALFSALIAGGYTLENLHFIGHSRGTVVNGEAIERLLSLPSSYNVDVDQVTNLDPHDWGYPYPYGFGHDHDVNSYHLNYTVTITWPPGTLPNDGVVSWKGVRWSDSYWQVNDIFPPDVDPMPSSAVSKQQSPEGLCDIFPESCEYALNGRPVLGTHNVEWSEVEQEDGSPMSHSGIYLEYIRTILNGARPQGYHCSRIGGGRSDATNCPSINESDQHDLIFNFSSQGLVNGDFERGPFLNEINPFPGWDEHGGGGRGDFDKDAGNGFLNLSFDDDWQRHDRFYIPNNAVAIQFDYRVVNASSDDVFFITVGTISNNYPITSTSTK